MYHFLATLVCLGLCSFKVSCKGEGFRNSSMIPSCSRPVYLQTVGIYSNTTKANLSSANHTVLMTHISQFDLQQQVYRQQVKNVLCASSYLGYSILAVVVIDEKLPLKELDDFLETSRAWSVSFCKVYAKLPSSKLMQQQNSISPSPRQQAMKSSMLLSTLDIVNQGFNVIYINSSVVLLRDIVPHFSDMIVGGTDVVLLPVINNCTFPSHIVEYEYSKHSSSDSILYFKSSAPTKRFLSHWLSNIVQINDNNQYVDITASDVLQSSNVTGAVDITCQERPPVVTNASNIPTSPRYCFMSEFAFHEYSVAKLCSRVSQDYINGLLSYSDILAQSDDGTLSPLAIISSDWELDHALLHYKLLDHNPTETCAHTYLTRSIFGSIEYSEAWAREKATRLTRLSRVPQGTLVRFFRHSSIFVVDKERLRPIPDIDTFTALGLQWNRVKSYDNDINICLRKGDTMSIKDLGRSDIGVQPHQPAHNQNHQHHHHKNKHPAPTSDPHAERIKKWTLLAERHFDPNRAEAVQKVLSSAAGVYTDKSRHNAHPDLSKVVLVNVVSHNKQSGDERYLTMLRNWYCYASEYGFNPITYLVPVTNEAATNVSTELLNAGVHASNVLTYPLHLFWSMLASKRNRLVGGRANYEGDVPSFSNHGALVMLMPLLEILQAGFNVMYLDLDTVMIQDPVPFLLKGSADFTVQQESRTCVFPSVTEFLYETDWEMTEANTGILFVRSTNKGVTFFTDWLKKIIEENVINDQKALEFSKLGGKISFSCNENLAYLDANSTFQSKLRFNDTAAPTYCLLNEFLFQNGKICLGCAKGLGGSKSEYMQAFYQHGHVAFNGTTLKGDDVWKGRPLRSADELRDYNNPTSGSVILPVMLHFNYCDDKIGEYRSANAWLVDDSQGANSSVCTSFNVSQSAAGSLNWDTEMQLANEDLRSAHEQFRNGSVLRLHRSKVNKLVLNGVLRDIPDENTFAAMGFKHKDVQKVRLFNFIKHIPVGPELPQIAPKS